MKKTSFISSRVFELFKLYPPKVIFQVKLLKAELFKMMNLAAKKVWFNYYSSVIITFIYFPALVGNG